MAIKRPDTPLAETPKPDYRNINKKTKVRSVSKNYVATSKDSTDYVKGFNEAIEGKERLFPSRAKVQGRAEAKQRGLTPKK
jgi:hypothetical protein